MAEHADFVSPTGEIRLGWTDAVGKDIDVTIPRPKVERVRAFMEALAALDDLQKQRAANRETDLPAGQRTMREVAQDMDEYLKLGSMLLSWSDQPALASNTQQLPAWFTNNELYVRVYVHWSSVPLPSGGNGAKPTLVQVQ